MLGQNVIYLSNLDDAQLCSIAKKERRVLITRDLELYQQATAKGLVAFYLEGETEAERLAELAKRFDISLEIDLRVSRCPKCNARIRRIRKENVASKVEKNTFFYYDDFWECSKCGQIYWQGAHRERIRKTLEDAKEKMRKD
jgi:hypothetical protein